MPTEPTKKPTVSPAELARLRERAAETRAKLVHKPEVSELLAPEEIADGAPFYFELRACIAELKKAREAAGLTLAQVAEKTGLATETLCRLETGMVTNPTWKTLGLYAVAVGRKLALDCESGPYLPKGSPPNREISFAINNTPMHSNFIRIIRDNEEVLINVHLIWKIEVGYFIQKGNRKFRVGGDRGVNDPEAIRTYKLFVGSETYMLAANPGDPVMKVLETLYKMAIKA